MPERRVEVHAYGVHYICDACKQGEMLALSGTQAFVQEKGQIFIRHVCNVCRTMAAYTEKYPTVRHEDVQTAPQGFQQPPGNNLTPKN
jgi:hypothetical protein